MAKYRPIFNQLNFIEIFYDVLGKVRRLPSHNSKINLKYASHKALKELILKRDNYQCKKCGSNSNSLELDHIIPYSKGGKHYPENLQILCHDCNLQKGNEICQTG